MKITRRINYTLILATLCVALLYVLLYPQKVAAGSAGYGIYVGGQEVTSENAASITGSGISGTISYDHASNTLTLKNATINKSGFSYLNNKSVFPVSVIGARTDSGSTFNIELIGKNYIKDVTVPSSLPADASTNDEYTWKASKHWGVEIYGINSKATLAFKGTGSLVIKDSGIEKSISVSDMTINKGSTVISRDSFIDATNVTVEGTLYAENSKSYGIWANRIKVSNNGTFTAYGKGGKAAIVNKSLVLGDKVILKAGTSSSKAYYASKFVEAAYLTAKAGLKISVKPTALSSLTRAKKGFNAKWKSLSGIYADGYQIRYSLKSSMNKAKIKTVAGSSKKSLKVRKLKAKKKYYVQIRAYKKVKGKRYYSSWSAKKKVKTK